MIYPGRVGRSETIGTFLHKEGGGQSAVLCGRVVGILDGEGLLPGPQGPVQQERGYILQDGSGKITVLAEKLPEVGTIVEAEVVSEASVAGSLAVRQSGESRLLAGCEDFYISTVDSPNYQKMILDEGLRENLIMRSRIIAAVREFFLGEAFLETDTPCLVRLPGMEPYLDVFKTRFEADFSADDKLSEYMYLITSPEYAMKKLLVGGMEKIFQVTRSFRNKETFSERHNPEFTILEWYRAFASYEEIMDDTERLVKFLWEKFGPRDGAGKLKKLVWKEKEIDIMAPWKRLRIIDAFQEMAGINRETFFNMDLFRAEIVKRGYAVTGSTGFDDMFYLIFLNEIEPRLGFEVPTILYDYPVSMAALSKKCAGDEQFAERFEAYVGGLELCNGFTELNDPVEQESRLNLEKEERKGLGKDVYNVDQTFINALKFGMPPSGGNALGVDRVIMLLLGEKDIRNTLFFPHRDL